MREIKTACITQTLCFYNHDGETTEYRILSEKTNEDSSIVIEIKKQYNTSPVGDYLN